MPSYFLRRLALTSLLLSLVVGLRGQPDNLLDREMKGIFPTGAYLLSDIETINSQNGNVLLNIPVGMIAPGRGGGGFTLSARYNSQFWESEAQIQTCGGVSNRFATQRTFLSDDSGWKLDSWVEIRARGSDTYYVAGCEPQCSAAPSGEVPFNEMPLGYHRQWRYELVDFDQSAHGLTPRGFEHQAGDPPGRFAVGPSGLSLYCAINPISGDKSLQEFSGTGPRTYYSSDSSYLRVEANSYPAAGSLITTFTVHYPDGTRVTSGTLGQERIDRNGNQVSRTVTVEVVDGVLSSVTTYVDDTGRSIRAIRAISGDTGNITRVLSHGANGELLESRIYWKTLSFSAQYTPYDLHDTTTSPPPGPATLPSIEIIDRIEVPAALSGGGNGYLVYTFGYGESGGNVSSTGRLQSMTTPSGVQVSYAYLEDAGQVPSVYDYEVVLKNPIASKIVSLEGSTYSEAWQYVVARNGLSATITAPDGGTTSQKFKHGLLYKTTNPDGGTIEQVWRQNTLGLGDNPIVDIGLPGEGVIFTNTYVSEEYIGLAVASSQTVTHYSIKSNDLDRNGNSVAITQYELVDAANLSRRSDTQPDLAVTSPVQLTRTERTFFGPDLPGSLSPGQNLCDYGFYCGTDQSVGPQTIRSVRSESVWPATGSAVARSEYCYDDYGSLGTGHGRTTANLAHMATWDDAKGALPAFLIDCQSGRQGVSAVANVVSREYDQYGNLTKEIDPRGTETVTAYGTISRSGGQASADALYPTSVTSAANTTLARTTSRTVDFDTGQPLTESDPNGNVSSMSYDRFGRLTRWAKNGYEALFDYADDFRYVFQRVKQSPSVYRQSVRRFDALGRPRLVQLFENGETFSATNESNGIKTRSEHYWGPSGNLEVVSNPFRDGSEVSMGWTRTSRDTAGRPVELRHISGSELPAPWGQNAVTTGASTTLYEGPTTTQTDQAGVKLASTVDGAGRLVKVVENPGGSPGSVYETNYQYSALGNLVRVEQPLDSNNSQVRQFVYSSLSRLISAANPETSGPITYSYDPAGNLLTRSHGGVVTSNSFDALNRMMLTTYSDGTPSVRYCYDGSVSFTGEGCNTASPSISNAIGRLTSLSNSVSGNLYTEFDGLGRVLRSVQKTGTDDPFEFAYSFNDVGDLTQITYPSGRTLDYTYDNAGRATSVGQNGGTTYLSVAAFHPHGAPVRAVLGNSLTEQSCFNARLQGVGMRTGDGESPSCAALATDRIGISMDFGATANNGNVRSQTVAHGGAGAFSQSFLYDAFNRLCSAVEGPGDAAPAGVPCTASAALGGNHWLQRYGMDRFGNRWVAQTESNNTQTVDPQTPAQSSDIEWSTNRVTGPGTYTYGDGRGNLTGLGARVFVYDGENRLQTSRIGAGAETTYHYDGAGRRVKKETPTGTTVYVYDAMGQLAAEYGTGAPAKTGTEYLSVDHLGSTRLVTNSSGTIVSRHDFLPFGEEINAGVGGRTVAMGYAQNPYAAIDPTQRFTGKERDTETGLDYFGARYFSGAMGRFTGPDPKEFTARTISSPQKWNKYAYVRNSPLLMVDPNGLDDFYVFRPIGLREGRAWQNVRAMAKANNHRLFLYSGSQASAERFNSALQTKGAHVIFTGHTIFNTDKKAGSLLLAGDKPLGKFGIPPADSSGSWTHPTGPIPNPSSQTLAVFGCFSATLPSEMSMDLSQTTYVGLTTYTEAYAADLGAASFIQLMMNGDSVGEAAEGAQEQMQSRTTDVNEQIKNDSQQEPYKQPEVKVCTSGTTPCN